MKIAITGGTGFVGSHVAAALVAKGHHSILISRGLARGRPEVCGVSAAGDAHSLPAARTRTECASGDVVSRAPDELRMFDREQHGRTGGQGPEPEVGSVGFVAADVADEESLVRAFEGCAGVAHCAGINREIGLQTYERTHVEGTCRVVEAARRAGVRKIALVSFLRARPGSGSPYHESKWAAEEIVRGSGLDFTIIKPGVIYGRGDHMLDHLSHAFHTFPVFALVGMRDRRVRPVAVEDVARILAASLAEGRLSGQTVFVLGPEELSLGEAVRRVACATGRRPLFIRIFCSTEWRGSSSRRPCRSPSCRGRRSGS